MPYSTPVTALMQANMMNTSTLRITRVQFEVESSLLLYTEYAAFSDNNTAQTVPHNAAKHVNRIHHSKHLALPLISPKPPRCPSKSLGPKTTPTRPPTPVLVMKEKNANSLLIPHTCWSVFCQRKETPDVTKQQRLIDKVVHNHNLLLITSLTFSEQHIAMHPPRGGSKDPRRTWSPDASCNKNWSPAAGASLRQVVTLR
mmetsp:Transcript_113525/g.321862  ORF Transcript_113525/g.321862 Transcript_113525/m.321862 type:complete len:200 (-) Transcript_113525:1090-1689(-)